jgi:fido (protein-threonine AMPylation protein)
MHSLASSISQVFSSGWPSWESSERGEGAARPPQFTIRLAQNLREEAERQHFVADPAEIIDKVRAGSQRNSSAKSFEAWEDLERALARLVYGSNMIESAGNSLSITAKLCQAVFRGEEVNIGIDERDADYKEHLEHLLAANRLADHEHAIRSRREIVQHAQALNHVIDQIVVKKAPWSEALILEAHRILHAGLDDEVEAGEYRSHEVAVKYEKPGQKKQKAHQCMRAKAVPDYMKDMIQHLNDDLAEAEKAGTLDPYTLAARYHHQFVNVHPFGDGNGRMSRIILNVLLLRYAGHVSEIGLDAEERDEYIRLATRASQVFHREDMEIDFRDHTGHLELARFILVKSKKNVERMWSWVTGRKADREESGEDKES